MGRRGRNIDKAEADRILQLLREERRQEQRARSAEQSFASAAAPAIIPPIPTPKPAKAGGKSNITYSETPTEAEENAAIQAFFTSAEGELPPGTLERVASFGQRKAIEFADEQRAREQAEEEARAERARQAEAERMERVQQASVESTEMAIMGGDQTELHQNIDPDGTQATVDMNPNNQPAHPDRAYDLLFSALRDERDLDSIRTAIAEHKQEQIERKNKQAQALKDLKARKVGMDLTPLASLIDDPNKAAILARTLKPGYTAEQKAAQIMDLENKFEEVNARDRKILNNLSIALGKEESRKSLALAQAAVQQAQAREMRAARHERKEMDRLIRLRDRQTKFLEASRNKFLSKGRAGSDIENIKAMSGTLDKLGDGGVEFDNPLIQSLVRFDLIRAVQPGGVITDKDLEAVSRQPDIRNVLESSVDRVINGKRFTETDQRNVALVLSLAIKGTKQRIKEQADAEALAVEKIFKTRHAMDQFKASDLTQPGEIYHIDQFVSPDLEPRLEELTKNANLRFQGKTAPADVKPKRMTEEDRIKLENYRRRKRGAAN